MGVEKFVSEWKGVLAEWIHGCMFFATMSHEMRTPLTACIGMAEVLLGTPLNERQKECVDAIALSGGALLQLVNDILDFSKLEADKLVLETLSFDIRECVEHSAQVVQLKADEKELELIVNIEPDVPIEAIGDSARLRQVLFNLLSNSVKFTEKGFVAVTCSTCVNGSRLRFEVKDTGIGLSPTTLLKLFKPFSQAESSTSRRFGGTGLGLVISKQIVEMMGGELSAQSEGEGRGSMFSFSIPRALPRQATRSTASPGTSLASPTTSYHSGSRTVSGGSSHMSVMHGPSFRSKSMAPPPIPKLPAFDPEVAERIQVLVIDRMDVRWQATCCLLDTLQLHYKLHSSLEDLETESKPVKKRDKEIILAHFKDFGTSVSEILHKIRALPCPPTIRRYIILITSLKHAQADSLTDGLACVSKPLTIHKLYHTIAKLGFASSYDAGMASFGRQRSCDVIPDGSNRRKGPVAVNKPTYSAKILVVDDVVVNQRVITLKLQQGGYTHIDTASSGLEALRMIRSAEFVYDIIFMDVSMPEMDGYETTRAIKGEDRYVGVPIVAVTGNCMPEDVEECLNSGMIAVLAKPINTEEMYSLIHELTTEDAEDDGKPEAMELTETDRDLAELKRLESLLLSEPRAGGFHPSHPSPHHHHFGGEGDGPRRTSHASRSSSVHSHITIASSSAAVCQPQHPCAVDDSATEIEPQPQRQHTNDKVSE